MNRPRSIFIFLFQNVCELCRCFQLCRLPSSSASGSSYSECQVECRYRLVGRKLKLSKGVMGFKNFFSSLFRDKIKKKHTTKVLYHFLAIPVPVILVDPYWYTGTVKIWTQPYFSVEKSFFLQLARYRYRYSTLQRSKKISDEHLKVANP
jgi:hypothetical protein